MYHFAWVAIRLLHIDFYVSLALFHSAEDVKIYYTGNSLQNVTIVTQTCESIIKIIRYQFY